MVMNIKTFAPPPKKLGFLPKNGKIWPEICIFGHFLPNIGLSDPYGSKPDQNNFANEVPWWFSDMRVPELLLSPKTIRIFGPETAIFGPKYAFLGTYRPCRLIWCPVVWWLWRAGCISRHTFTLLCYESFTLIFFKELISSIFQVCQAVRHRLHLSRSPLCSIYNLYRPRIICN